MVNVVGQVPAVRVALQIAGHYHNVEQKQTYRGGDYVTKHIIPVWQKVKEARPPLEVEVAAILHDIVEDTSYGLDQVRHIFGSTVADLVWRLTDEPGVNRTERKRKTYPKIRANKWAVLIKLADRYVNTKDSEKKEMYQKEFDSFKKNLYIRNTWDRQWKELEQVTK